MIHNFKVEKEVILKNMVKKFPYLRFEWKTREFAGKTKYHLFADNQVILTITEDLWKVLETLKGITFNEECILYATRSVEILFGVEDKKIYCPNKNLDIPIFLIFHDDLYDGTRFERYTFSVKEAVDYCKNSPCNSDTMDSFCRFFIRPSNLSVHMPSVF
jgi:hypothetical protein